MNVSAALVTRVWRGNRHQERGKTLGELLLQIPLQLLIGVSRQSNDGPCLVPCRAAQYPVDRDLGSLPQNIEQCHVQGRLRVVRNQWPKRLIGRCRAPQDSLARRL